MKYKPLEVNREMLLEIGYSKEIIGTIIKLICKG
jgi:hypothetical protein